jgi:raffinose/stachyose/melibiose transport system permease protein
MKSKATPIMMVLPLLALYGLFVFYPLGSAIVSSLFQWNGILSSPKLFVGLRNYGTVLSDPALLRAFANSGRFILGSFLFLLPLSFTLAVIITSNHRISKILRGAYFLPVVLPLTAISLMWRFIMYPNGGPLVALLSLIAPNAAAVNLLGNPDTSIWAVIFVNMWTYAGFNMLIFAAGLVSIPQDIWDATEIDGARGKAKFFNITLPLMKESFKAFIVLAVSGSLKVFDIVFVMTGGGPNGASDVPATLLYYQAFKYSRFGLGNTIGTMIFILGLVWTLLVNRVISRLED